MKYCRKTLLPASSVMALALLTASSTFADYPLVSHRYAADPTGMEFNGRLYIYCSNDDDNNTSSYSMHSITCFSTDDLKNWTDHGVVLNVPANVSWANLSWAPSAISNNSKVYLYFANGAGTIGVTTSSVPVGPFKDARGSALISGSTPGASSSTQWLFDPCAFIDDNGQAYVYFGGQYPTNARVIRLNSNLTSVSGAASPMFATNFFEASYIHKRNGIYYYTYCNQFSVGAAIYCETNSNPTNGFVPQGVVLANPPVNVNNNNHHSIVSYLGNWYIVYHNRAAALANGLSNGQAVYKRSICLDALNYNANGGIIQVTPTTDGLPQLKHLDPYKGVEAETIAQQFGIKTEVCSEGGLDVTSITNGCWIRVRGVDFGSGASTFYARVASAGSGGNIELHLDSLGGTLVGTCAVPSTGGSQTWTTVSCNVSGAAGVHDLYFKFTGGPGNLFNFNSWQFAMGGPSLAHRYSFSEINGTTVADSVAGPVWNGVLPAGGTFSSGTLGLLSSSQQYASLPAGIVGTLTDFTIEAWVNLTTTNDWARLFDFGNSTTVNMFLTPRNGSDGRLRFAVTTSGNGAEQRITGPSGLTPGQWYHVAVTLSSTTGILYLNGTPVATNNSMTLNPTALGPTANNYIGKSQYPDPYMNGSIDEFRIYNVALSPAELAATYALGPNQVLSTNSPTMSASSTATDLTMTWPLENAGFTVQTSTNLELGNWINVTTPAPQIVGGRWQITLPSSPSEGATFYRLAK